MEKKLIIAIALILFGTTTSKSQSKYVLSEYGVSIDRVIDAKSIVYFGIDFSEMRLTNPKKISSTRALRKFFPAWIADFDKDYEFEYRVKKYMKKDELIYRPENVQKRFELVVEDWIVFGDHSFDVETVKSIVKSYSLEQQSGVGLVVNIENFNKPQERGVMYITFFDISTREVLWAVEMYGPSGGWGMTSYWSTSIKKAFDKFFDLYRNRSKELRKSRKRK